MEDIINHPKHYELDKIECIDAMEMTQGRGAVMSFCLCNAFKYLWRHDRKNGLEDIKKAKWYLDKYLELADRPEEDEAARLQDALTWQVLNSTYGIPSEEEGSNKKETAYEYFKRKRDEFDDMIDEIAAEHKKTSAPLDHISNYGDKEEAALWRIMNGLCVILFETPTDYCDFRIKYSDRLLLPKPESIYGKHPEILEHDWPVVIYVEFAPCSNYGGNCRYTGNIAWAIAQSDWRETKTVDGKKIYIYSEKEWA